MWRDLLTKGVISQAGFWDGWKLLTCLICRASKSSPELSCYRENQGSILPSHPKVSVILLDMSWSNLQTPCWKVISIKFLGALTHLGPAMPTTTLVDKGHFLLSSQATSPTGHFSLPTKYGKTCAHSLVQGFQHLSWPCFSGTVVTCLSLMYQAW